VTLRAERFRRPVIERRRRIFTPDVTPTPVGGPVRRFNAVLDEVILFDHTAMSGIDGTEKNTLAFLWRADTIHAGGLFYLTGSSNVIYGVNPYGSGFVWYTAGGNALQGPAYNADETYLTLFTKNAGTSEVRSHTYNYETDTWSHANHGSLGTGANAPAQAPFQMGRWDGVDEYLDGWLAVAAIWVDTMPWATDGSGDAAIEAAGLEVDYQNWIDAGPAHAWRFNQDSVATPVVDDVGSADQTSISGTSVDTTQVPPGFDFSFVAAPPAFAGWGIPL
jgi:hypothetical protein